MRLISAGSLVRAQSGPFFTDFRPFLAIKSVILNSNPLDDIAHSSKIETVIKKGVACPANSILRSSVLSSDAPSTRTRNPLLARESSRKPLFYEGHIQLNTRIRKRW